MRDLAPSAFLHLRAKQEQSYDSGGEEGVHEWSAKSVTA